MYNYIKENKLLLVFLLIWLILYVFGNITFLRIIIFICILIYIYLYKQLLNSVFKIRLSENVIYILLWIDSFKLIIYHFFFFVYIILYDIKFKYELEWLSSKLTWIFEYFIVFPYYVIMHKYYKILEIWKQTSLNKIILLRLYGTIISILVFSPIIWWIFEFLNKNFIYCYLFFVLIIYVHENLKWILKYKYLNKLEFILLLNILIEPTFIFSYRNKISIFSILIKNTIYTLNKNESKTNKFAFSINAIYLSMFGVSINLGQLNLKLDEKELLQPSKRYIYNYKSIIKQQKIISMRKTIINEDKFIFCSILSSYFINLDIVLRQLTNVTFAKIKSEELNIDIDKLKRIEIFIKHLIEVLLFYLLDLSLTYKSIEDIKKEFKLGKKLGVLDLEYKLKIWVNMLQEENIQKWKQVTWELDLEKYINYYELMYIYMHIIDLYNFRNYSIDNSKNYKHIYKYINILLSDLSVLNIKNDRENSDIYEVFDEHEYVTIRHVLEVEYESYENTQLGSLTKDIKKLKEELENYKNQLLEKWEKEIYELNKENFYKKNMERLKILDNYVLEEIKKYKNNN